jgi:hypothetical protein
MALAAVEEMVFVFSVLTGIFSQAGNFFGITVSSPVVLFSGGVVVLHMTP